MRFTRRPGLVSVFVVKSFCTKLNMILLFLLCLTTNFGGGALFLIRERGSVWGSLATQQPHQDHLIDGAEEGTPTGESPKRSSTMVDPEAGAVYRSGGCAGGNEQKRHSPSKRGRVASRVFIFYFVAYVRIRAYMFIYTHIHIY